jgi:aspartyl-tRNA synthetase
MIAGFDKYFQIAKCFRDEDLRADRQPEFTQIDMEMSFLEQKDLMELNEGLMKRIWKEFLGIDLVTPFPVIDYSEAIRAYGVDRPDTRFEMLLVDLQKKWEK